MTPRIKIKIWFSMSDPRNQVKKIRQQEILEAFEKASGPVLTTGEVSEKIESVTQETVRDDLKTLRGGDIDGKKTDSGWIWWVTGNSSETSDEKVATGEELQRAIADLVISRHDFRVFTASLSILAILSIGGVAIYLMLEANTWLLPISQQTAILYNYASMVATGLVIVFSGLIVLANEWIRKG